MMRNMHLLVSLLFFSASLTAAPWARVAGGVSGENFRDLEVDPTAHRIAVGYTVSDNQVDGWLVVHDPFGKLLWQRKVGLPGDGYTYDITLTSDGGYVLVGYTGVIPDYDLWIVKLDPKYKIQWRRLIGARVGTMAGA